MKGLHLALQGERECGAWAHLQGKVQGTKAGRIRDLIYTGFLKDLWKIYGRFKSAFVRSL